MTRNWKREVVLLISVLSVVLVFVYSYYGITLHLEPKKKTVMFLETSGTGTLSLRQLASVESAARFIPNSKVIVFVFTEGSISRSPHMVNLEEEYNVQFNKTTFKDFISNTPLEPWYNKGIWKTSPFVVSHMSDALRYLSLWLFGGIYLDLDVIITRMWDVKDNTVITEVPGRLGSAVLVFKKQHPVLLSCLTWLENNYEPFVWIANGPALITDKVNEYIKDNHRQDNISVLPASAFYEVNFNEVHKLFNANFTTEVLNRTKPSFGVHVWNKLSSKISVPKTSSCAYNIMLNKSSPITYAAMQIKTGEAL